MSADGSISFDWGDAAHRFRIGIDEAAELAEKTGGKGPAELYHRIITGKWLVHELREIIRIGLIGGGLKPVEALELVRSYVDKRPFEENTVPAQAILAACLVGVPDDPAGKSPATMEKKEAQTLDASPSPPSTKGAIN